MRAFREGVLWAWAIVWLTWFAFAGFVVDLFEKEKNR